MVPRQTPREKLQDVLALLKELGWKQTGRYRFTPPFTLVGITPEGTPDRWWGSKMFPRFRALDINLAERPVYFAEQQNTPWVLPVSQKMTVGHVAGYLKEVTDAAQCGFLAAGPRPVPVIVPLHPFEFGDRRNVNAGTSKPAQWFNFCRVCDCREVAAPHVC